MCHCTCDKRLSKREVTAEEYWRNEQQHRRLMAELSKKLKGEGK